MYMVCDIYTGYQMIGHECHGILVVDIYIFYGMHVKEFDLFLSLECLISSWA